jgi:cyanophycinase-like exopeptidase
VRRQKSLDALLSAGMIYLGGGVTANLVDTIRETPAELALRDAANNGAVIAAIGAAASAFGAFAGRGAPGLAWLENTVVDAGYSDEVLRRLMSLPDTQMGVGIPPKTALAIKAGGDTEIVGDGQIAVFRRPSGV